MKNKIDEIYDDIRGRIVFNPRLFVGDPKENMKILSKLVKTVNIAKCDLVDLDIESPNGALYLMYLLEKKMKVPFGICPDCRVISNKNGISVSCKNDSKIKCKGFRNSCPVNISKEVVLGERDYW